MQRLNAFTLIELLVVIAVVGALAAIALPVFSRVQEKAKATADAGNLRQLGIGIIAFADDNDESLADSASDTIIQVNEKVGGLNSTAAEKTTITRIAEVFVSPFDKRGIEPLNQPVSYGFNDNIFSEANGNLVRLKSISRYILMAPAPSGTEETTPDFKGTATQPVNIYRNKLNKSTPLGTHGNRKKINALFADGHVETMTWGNFLGDRIDSMQWYYNGK